MKFARSSRPARPFLGAGPGRGVSRVLSAGVLYSAKRDATGWERHLFREESAAPRVAVLVGSFPKLSETFVIDQIAGLIVRGCKVGVFAREPARDGLAHPSVQGLRLAEPARFASDSWIYRALGRLRRGRRVTAPLRRWAIARSDRRAADYPVLLCHFGAAGLRAAELHRRGELRGEIWTVFHGSDLSSFLKRSPPDVYKHLFACGSRFLPVSEFWRARLIELGCPADRISVHRMGVDTAAFPFRPRAESPIVNLISVARLVEKKGLEVALEALAVVRRERPEADWRYRIVGDGPLRAQLTAAAQRLGLWSRVDFMGAQSPSAVRRLVDESDIFVLPSVTARNGDQEGVPVSLMEAMANGAAVASTFHSGIPELVEDGVSGLLAAERDVDGLAANLLRLMIDPLLRRRLAFNARAKVEMAFDREILNDQLHAMICEAPSQLGGSSRRPKAAR